MMKKQLLLWAALALLAGCAVNPVTGKSELSLVSEQQELAIGAEQYAPARQSQGGDYTVDQELTAYVSQVGQRLAAVSDRKLPYEFKVLNSSVPNAWALPGGKITINRGLLTELQNEAELAAVLGHEIVHAAAGHGAQSISKGMLLQAGAMGVAIATEGTSYASLAQMGTGLGAQLITQKYGRDAERESDYYGMQYMVRAGYDPQAAVTLQQTFVRLAEGKQQDWISGLFASHPPSQERVQNNIAESAKLPRGGDLGVERYRAKVAHLLQTKPAYKVYDDGRKALANGDLAGAGRLARQAIALEPREGHFYALLGDVEQKSQRPQQALTQYDKAISLNPNFFNYYLQRGKVEEQLNLAGKAQADLERSVALLPTADAYYLLGKLAQKAGRLNDAKDYYAKVAGSQGEVGQQAYGTLVDLDLKENPGKYVEVRAGEDNQGRILAQVINPTPRDIGNIVLIIQVRDSAGRVQQVQRNLVGKVSAGTQQFFDLGLAGQMSKAQLKSLQAVIARAEVVR